MTRRLLNLLTALSLLVCVAGVALWGRSYRAVDIISLQTGRRTTVISSDTGTCGLVTSLYDTDYGHSWAWRVNGEPEFDAPSAVRALGRFEWDRSKLLPPTLLVACPHWVVPALFGVMPAVRFSRWRRRRRTPAGLCPGCGYDLTGNVSGVCPECGGIANG